MRLSDLASRALPLPERGQKMHWDDTLKGFGVRVSQGGTRTFVLMHGRSRQLTTLGRVGVISLADARAEARRLLAERALGKTRQLSHTSFEQAVAKFLETHTAKESTKNEYRQLYQRYFLPKLRHESLERIQTSDLTRILDKLADRPAQASHAYAAISVLLNWAKGRRLIQQSPLEGLAKPKQGGSRERVLTDTEIASIFRVENPPTIGRIIQLILLTGQRPGQIGALRADYITGDLISWPASAMKNGRSHQIVFGPMAGAIFAALPSEGFLFPTRKGTPYSNWSNGKNLFDSQCGVKDYTCHDCRRTWATKAAEWDVADPVIIECVLAHKAILGGVAGIYNRFKYVAPMRRAMQGYEDQIQTLL